MLIDNVEAGMVLANDIFDEYGNLLLEKGIALTASYIRQLKRLEIRDIAIDEQYGEDPVPGALIDPQLRNELDNCFRSLFELKTEQLFKPRYWDGHLTQIRSTLGQVIDEAANCLPGAINLKIRLPGDDEINHAVNVCLLSLTTGLYLKFPQVVLEDLAMGALFHDIGRTVAATADDDCINSEMFHPLFGQTLLSRAAVSPVVGRIAAEHHEAYDGSGYPMGLAGPNIHPLARLVAITDFFETGIAAADHDHTLRQEVVETMLGSGNTLFDINILRSFFHTVPVYPAGARVRLSTGETAQIVKNRVYFPFRPIVRTDGGLAQGEIDLAFRHSITITGLIAE